MPFVSVLFAMGAVLVSAMSAAAIVARRTDNGGYADVFWSFAIGIAGALGALWPIGDENGVSSRQAAVALLALCWSLRLGSHIATRTIGGEEDARYADLKRTWGPDHFGRLFGFLQLQALAGVPLAGAIMLAAHRHGGWPDGFDVLGAIILAAGVAGAGIADRTLRDFKAKKIGPICDRGLWAWSRHPNYFFEWVGWCAWPIIAFDFSGSYPAGLLAFAAPALMYYLLVHVSGVPPLEAHMERSRGAAFADYKARTPVFFPWPPGWQKPNAHSISKGGST